MAKKEETKSWIRRHPILAIPVIIIAVFVILFIALVIIGLVIGPSTLNSGNQAGQKGYYFYDNQNNCTYDGDVRINNNLIGKATQGMMPFTYEQYQQNIYMKDKVLLCISGTMGSCFKEKAGFMYELCWYPANNYTSEDFKRWSRFLFSGEVSIRNPVKRGMMGFVRPIEAASFVSAISLTGTNKENIIKIAKYLDAAFIYISDKTAFGIEDYWRTPQEVFISHEGDCEDWTNAFLSAILYYKPDAKCYNVLLSTHLTNFCYLGDGQYSWIDQSKVQQFTKIDSSDDTQERVIQLREFRNGYFDQYGIRNNQNAVIAAYNDKEYVEFRDNEDFINWLLKFIG